MRLLIPFLFMFLTHLAPHSYSQIFSHTVLILRIYSQVHRWVTLHSNTDTAESVYVKRQSCLIVDNVFFMIQLIVTKFMYFMLSVKVFKNCLDVFEILYKNAILTPWCPRQSGVKLRSGIFTSEYYRTSHGQSCFLSWPL